MVLTVKLRSTGGCEGTLPLQHREAGRKITVVGQPVHIYVGLDEEEPGYPPVRVEELDAIDLGGGHFKLQSAPAFAFGIAPGDILQAEANVDGRLWAVAVVRPSDNWLARVVPQAGGSPDPALMEFAACGCTVRLTSFGLITVVVPPEVEAAPLLDRLRQGRDVSNEWHFDLGVGPDLT